MRLSYKTMLRSLWRLIRKKKETHLKRNIKAININFKDKQLRQQV